MSNNMKPEKITMASTDSVSIIALDCRKMVAGIANIFLQSSAMMLTLSVLAIVIFSGFMLFDIKRVIDGGETNYISATLSIYLSIYNVFQSLLAILGIAGGERD